MIILNTININHKNLKLLLKGHFLGGGGGELHQQPKESKKKKIKVGRVVYWHATHC